MLPLAAPLRFVGQLASGGRARESSASGQRGGGLGGCTSGFNGSAVFWSDVQMRQQGLGAAASCTAAQLTTGALPLETLGAFNWPSQHF